MVWIVEHVRKTVEEVRDGTRELNDEEPPANILMEGRGVRIMQRTGPTVKKEVTQDNRAPTELKAGAELSSRRSEIASRTTTR